MSDQNQMDQVRQKIQQFWNVFLEYLTAAVQAARRGGRRLAQRLAVLALKIRDFLKEEVEPRIRRAGEWIASVVEWIRGKLTRTPEIEMPLEAPVLPPVEEPAAPDAPVEEAVTEIPAEPAEEAVIETTAEPVPQSGGRELLQKTGKVLGIVGGVVKEIVHWIWRLRKLIMAIPVVWAALKLAAENMDRLPDMVGLDIQSTGEFAQMVSRETAVYGPLTVTAFCLLLMCCSKKPLLPWVISIFTLILPVLIWLTNYYA